MRNPNKKRMRAAVPFFKYEALKRYIPLLKDRSIGHLLAEKWNIELFKELKRARLFMRDFSPENVNRIFIFSYSRGGSHNFVSRFHFLPCAFCFREQAFESEADPFQMQVHSHKLRALHFLLLSLYSKYGLQEKLANELSHLIFLNNRYLEHEGPLDLADFDPSRDKIIFYIRNIFRVIYSRDKSDLRLGKPKPRFKINEPKYQFALQQHKLKLKEIMELKRKYPDSVNIYIHENFCAHPEEVLAEAINFMGIDSALLDHWDKPDEFFVRCFGVEEKPIIKDQKLWCQNREESILATGGNFNPLFEPDLSRTMKDDLSDMITADRYNYAVNVFGHALADFWLEDKNCKYSQKDTAKLLKLMNEMVMSEF